MAIRKRLLVGVPEMIASQDSKYREYYQYAAEDHELLTVLSPCKPVHAAPPSLA
jgi:hypothetical protein